MSAIVIPDTPQGSAVHRLRLLYLMEERTERRRKKESGYSGRDLKSDRLQEKHFVDNLRFLELLSDASVRGQNPRSLDWQCATC
jgi:hypothetical protein